MNKDIFLLGIETSTTNCSVSISKNGENIALEEDNSSSYSHAESLHVFIEAALHSAELTLKDLHGIVVSKGPGSYTGLRIGVSTAKGFCYSLGVPLIAIDTLESLTYSVTGAENSYIIPMLDARRMEVYTAIFDTDYQVVKKTNALVLDASSYATYLNEKTCVFIGNGVAKFKDICSHPNAIYKTQHYPSALQLDQIGFSKFQNQQFEDVAYFEPYYLKDFVAIKPKK